MSDAWGLSGNYHEFAFGLPRDDDGNFYIGLNVAFFSPKWWHGKSPEPWRGWVIRVTPDGEAQPVASGFRSPCGLGRNLEGDLFITDNQGDWMPTSPIFHLQEGSCYGHPASLDWTEGYRSEGKTSTDTDPPLIERAPAAAWIPYKWSRSTGNLVACPEDNEAFGPFAGQMFVAELTNGNILRASFEKVRGQYQGAVFLFRQGVGSSVRARFAPDGSIFLGRTNRGWGGQSPADGLARIRPTGELPMEMRHVAITSEGFDVHMTRPIAADCNPGAADVALEQFDYNYWWEYGSPELRTRAVAVKGVRVSEDRRTLSILADVKPGKVARCVLSNIVAEGGQPLLHTEFDYTVNQLPEGPLYRDHVAKLVPAPDPIEDWNEGWVLLTDGDAGDAWSGDGWRVLDPSAEKASLDVRNAKTIVIREQAPAEGENGPRWRSLVHDGTDDASLMTCRYDHEAIITNIDFFLPEGGEAGVYLQGRYEVRLRDTKPGAKLTLDDIGGIGEGKDFPGRAPAFHSFRGPGTWNTLTKFDEAGNKIADARFLRVRVNDVLLHENVVVPGPTAGAPFSDEAAAGPMVLRAGSNGAAFRRISFRTIERPEDDEGFEPLFNRIHLEGWKQRGKADWSVEDGVIVGRGEVGHLFSPRDDYRNFEFRAQVKISSGGNSGMYFRTALGDGWPAGYEAQVNSDYPPDPIKTGSLYGMAPVKTSIVPPNTWFEQHILCRDVDEGVRITIRLNGVEVVDYVDTERKHASGHFALQQHHVGSEVRYRNLEVRELR